MIIGVVGTIASGKDTVAEYLKDKEFLFISLSDILRNIMRAEGIELTIKNMTEYGNNLRETKEHGYLARLALEKIHDQDAIITSIRQVGEIELLKKQSGFHLLKVDASKELRLKRLLERGREGDIKNIEELNEIEAKQADGKGGAMNMNACLAMADYEIINDGTLEELHGKVDNLLKKIEDNKEDNVKTNL